MTSKPSQWILLLGLFALFVIIPTAWGQDIVIFDRVTLARGTDEETALRYSVPVPLRVGDVVNVEVRRLSGDLIPYLALYNTTARRFAIRIDANVDNPTYLTYSYTIEPEARDGDYELIVTSTLETPTSGDFALTYDIERDGQSILPSSRDLDALRLPSTIFMNAGSIREGVISDDQWQVDYLVYLDADTPVEVRVTATSGDLQPFLGVSPAEDLDYNILQPGENGAASAQFPADYSDDAVSGYYLISVSRADFDQGATTGSFQLEIVPIAEGEA